MKTVKSIQLSRLFVVVLISLVLFSCKKPKEDNDTDTDTPTAGITQKVYVLNEGSFLNSNASVSIFDLSNKIMYNDLFSSTNGSRPLGDVLQSMAIVNKKCYFVLNNSDKIEVTDTYPLTSKAVINGLNMPRYIVPVGSNKAYVSEYVSYSSATGRVSVLDLTNNTVSSTISVGVLPEAMLANTNKLYVCISGEDKVQIINTSTDATESTITVAKGPNSIVKDSNGKLWVLCGGELAYDGSWNVDPVNSIPGALVKIDPVSNTVEATYTFASTTGSPSRLTIDGTKMNLYFTYESAVYTMPISSTSLPTQPLINRNFYGLGVDPVANIIYTGTYGFSSNQQMIRYAADGNPIDSFAVGVGTNGFVFQY